MTLNRRQFSQAFLGSSLAGAGLEAGAQSGLVDGVNFVSLGQPLPVADPGKVEVIEFFWYECPHCNAFEPALEAWTKKLPVDVSFKRVPIWFREVPFTAQQRLYYALEALELVPTLHRKIFYAIHVEHLSLRSPEEMAAFMLKNGVDPMKFMAAYSSFAVQTKVQQARQVAAAYKIDAVPAMGVQGRFYTNGALANAGGAPNGSNDRMLVVVDALIARSRRPHA